MENENKQAPPTRELVEVIEIMQPVFDWATRDALKCAQLRDALDRIEAAAVRERDRLRDLVGKLAQRIQLARLADPNPGGEDPLLREAAAVCKMKREET